jgi:hypothetical protein
VFASPGAATSTSTSIVTDTLHVTSGQTITFQYYQNNSAGAAQPLAADATNYLTAVLVARA